MRRRAVIVAMALATAVSGLALTTASSVAAGSLPTLTLAVTKNTIAVGGSKVSGAVNVAVTVSGEAKDNPALVLLKPGVTAAELGAAVSKFGRNTPLDAIDPYATIVYDSQDAVKGATTTGQAVLPAGNYVAVNNGNGFAPFTISASSAPASLPTPGATVTAIDFGFRGASTLHDGELVRFEDDGWLIHMFSAAPVGTVARAKNAEALLLEGKLSQAKKYAVAKGGELAGPLSHGSMQQSVITQKPGVYILLCAMNAEDGRDHFQLGMFRTIRIVK